MAGRSHRNTSKPEWQNTWLWGTLEKRAKTSSHAAELILIVKSCMQKMVTILESGGTSPNDFTLHDSKHAFRVANRIEDLITPPIRRNISDYEVALLLLSAYGHDIGMTPERNKVNAHHRYLFGHKENLSTEEQHQFQEFLDNYPDLEISLPLSTKLKDLNLADELTAFYVRDRHNEWSADWLRNNLSTEILPNLDNWVNILIRLCSSHHLDFSQLTRSEFNPFLSGGSRPQLIHLRYLSCLLRLADILENDPERTPDILYRHRGISERTKSLIYWQRDHALAIDIRESRVHLQARPQNAVAHKAISQLADWIDYELHGISSLGENLPSEYKIGKSIIRRDWHLAPALTRDTHPFDNSYEYIDGSFRPNTARLLQLLSNEQLYGSSLVAVRELLQNAFDAVREKIARRRLEPHISDPSNRSWSEKLGNEEKVTLTLKPSVDGGWLLICEDTGVGLTKSLITGHLLVSGQSRRHAIIDLERRCNEKGFSLGRTGQFGIGVLSYFMLAEEVNIITTRYQGCQDNDAPGWEFTTLGVGSFGELRKKEKTGFPIGGTRVQWKLQNNKVGNITFFAKKLRDFLLETLCYLPCPFELIVEKIDNIEGWKCDWGWAKSVKNLADKSCSNWIAIEKFLSEISPYSTEKQKDEIDKQKKSYPEHFLTAVKSLKTESIEIDLLENIGTARISLCYFDLPEGRSMVFLPGNNLEGYFTILHKNYISWKGMQCDLNESFNIPGIIAELDFIEGNTTSIDVSRLGMKLINPNFNAWWKDYFLPMVHEWSDKVLSGGNKNFYHELNLYKLQRKINLREGYGWYLADGSFTALKRPFAAKPNPLSEQRAPLYEDGRIIQNISLSPQGNAILDLNCTVRLANPRSPRIFYYWPNYSNQDDKISLHFPDEWIHVLAIIEKPHSLFNPDHPITALLSESEKKDIFNHKSSPWKLLDSVNKPQQAAFALLKLAYYLLSSKPNPNLNEWQGYRENRSENLIYVWKLLNKEVPDKFLSIWITDDYDGVILNPTDSIIGKTYENIHLGLPKFKDENSILRFTPV